MKRALKISLVLFGILLVLLLSALLYCIGVTAGVRLDAKKLQLDTACVRLYDGTGREIELPASSAVPFSELPAHLPQAFVAVEDKRFYSHNGLDFKRMGGAILKNLRTLSFREGASTISQQLIKNTHLTSEKTINRKLKEIKLARQLEKKYSKEEILEMYLNSIYFGHDAFGVKRAAQLYFGKEAEQLTVAESAMLAALVKSPNRYSPFRDEARCKERRDLVLKLMREQGYLTESEWEKAIEEPLPDKPHETASNSYISLVFEELSAILPDVRAEEMGNLRVETFYSPSLQETLEEQTAPSDVCLLVRGNDDDSLMALHSTCGILKRLPASTLKPLLVYGPALEEDFICPATPILDEKTDFSGYSPDDAGGATGKYMSARYALSRSVNIPAVKLLNSMGCERAASYLEKMDLHVDKSDYTLALALGGMKEGFSLPALADAYATFAKGGVFSRSQTIAKITDESGRVLYKKGSPQRRVFSEETSYLLNDMLQTAAKEGTARRLKALPFPVCAKTGTAEGKSGNTDAYTICYTKDHTVAVWMGNRDNTPIDATGGGLPANTALSILKDLYKAKAPSPFPMCDNVEACTFDREEYELHNRIVLSDPLAPLCSDCKDLFKKSALPKEVCTRFSAPRIEMPSISVKNGAVNIVLCQTEYYDYIIKRENRGITATIYQGKYQKLICDNSVRSGEQYRYSVTPVYRDRIGETVYLPLVQIDVSSDVPDEWWSE